jgi:hypothetical protein
VQDTTGTATYTDSEAQFTVWGISHEGIYNTDIYGGHVAHIDSYRRELESRLISGLGGVFFSARTRAESGTDYLIPSTTISLQDRVLTSKAIGPFFYDSLSTSAVTRAVQASDIVDNKAVVDRAEYSGTTGEVHFYLTLTDKVGTLAGLTTDDKLTVSNMAFRILNGTHDILAVDDSLNRITVSIPDISTDDFDETSSCGKAGVFTDTLTLDSTSPFVVGDELTSNLFDGLATPTVTAVSGAVITLDGITDEVSVPGGMLLRGQRTSADLSVSSVTNFVAGDMCTITDFDREFRVVSVDATNSTITIDESITYSDQTIPVTVAVTGRWIPIEAPISDEDRIRRTYQQYLDTNDYDEQSIVRSTMLQDSMFFTNGDDEIYKFDGTNLYRAGLPRWQPQLFVSLDTSNPAIQLPDALAAVSAVSSNEFTVDTTAAFSVNQQIVHDDDSTIYTVTGLDTTAKKVYVNATISGAAAGNLRGLRKLQYYFRLNAIDINQNIVASATTGVNDYIVNLTDDGQIELKLIGLPPLDAYDFDRIEVQIYRADAGVDADPTDNVGVGEFFRVGTVDLSYDNYEGYILFIDNSDGQEALNITDEVTARTALVPGELGNTWTQPLRAKYITTASNRLVLANVRDYPELNITLRQASGANITVANLVDKKFILRRTGSGTTTDMLNTVGLQFRNATAATSITPASAISNAAASSFTVTATHSFLAGDWVYLFHSAADTDNSMTFAGWHQIASVVGTTSFTINSNTGTAASTANDVDRFIGATTTTDVPVVIGTDGNYNNVGGNSSLSYERLAMIRLANALNAVMAVTDTTITKYKSFIPWATAAAGDEIGLGTVVIRAPRADITAMNITLPATITNAELIVNQVLADFGSVESAQERQFPSRLITSYANFGEIFDGSFGLEVDSPNVFDISPADGQEITAIITFFARAPFSSAQVEDMLVVFKENSIHVVNLTSGEVKRLETQGIGCSVPFSVAYSRNGIIFAHESGLYRLDKDLNISYVGKYLERLWQDGIVKNALSRATGTHYNLGRQYKLSVPLGTDQVDNNQVLVYDHTRETDQRVEFGAWSRYDNHPVTGWANLENDAYFGSTTGDVFKLRNIGDETDYRDDTDAIEQSVVYAPLDFGLPGSIKMVSNMVVQFQLRRSDLTGAVIESAVDFSNVFQTLDSFTKTQDTNDGGLDQELLPSVFSVKFSLPERRAEFFQIKFTNSTLDEDMTITGISFGVAASSGTGILEANTTLT